MTSTCRFEHVIHMIMCGPSPIDGDSNQLNSGVDEGGADNLEVITGHTYV